MFIDQFRQQKKRLVDDLCKVERVLVDMETSYNTNEAALLGTVLKGFESHILTKDKKKSLSLKGYRPEDRLFSLSSRSSPASLEQAAAEAADLSQGGGGLGVVGGVKKAAWGQK
ncbi:uncharacterized protein HaLaN_19410, partial [Haematococcus lacustris]